MSLAGYLTDFPLIEIFQLIERGKKTGVLTLFNESVGEAKPMPIYYIWVYRGRLVAAAKQLDHRGLVKLIHQRQWLSPRVVSKLAQLCPDDTALGLHFKKLGILRRSQLNQLFFLQVLQPVGALSRLQNGQFRFDQNVPLPMQEMTGLSIAAGAVKLFAPAKDTQDLRFEECKPSLSHRNIARHSSYSETSKKNSSVQGLQEHQQKFVFT